MEEALVNAPNVGREVVVVQGLGFVGTAMVAALAAARDALGAPVFTVIGVDLPTASGRKKIEAINRGESPIVSEDPAIGAAIAAGRENGNLRATDDEGAFELADVVVVDVNLDVHKKSPGAVDDYEFTYAPFEKALDPVAERVGQNTLVIIETTVPPGTVANVVRPLFEDAYAKRRLDPAGLLLAHSYERVMPGREYLRSITHYFRVFSGINAPSGRRARQFLESFIDTKAYPLSELHSTTASEMAKVLENSFRAMNIAFIQEWTEFAHAAGVNLFEVIDAIRMRSTHRNIMLPGFGVGGYCLTKDALLADFACRETFGGRSLTQSLQALRINDLMPDWTCHLLNRTAGRLDGRRIAIFGVSYLNDVGDTRYTPTKRLYDHCRQAGAHILLHDPLLDEWEEPGLPVEQSMEAVYAFDPDIAVFCVAHHEYRKLDSKKIMELMPSLAVLVDAFDVIGETNARTLAEAGVTLAGVGKGHWELPGGAK